MAATVKRPKRWGASLLLDKLQGVLETPKSVWEFRVNQQNFHGHLASAFCLEEILKSNFEIDFHEYFVLVAGL